MTTQIFLDGKVELRPGDCRDAIKAMPDNSVDSVVTDPPYALVSIQKRFGGDNAKPTKDGDVYMRSSAGFMNKNWDTGETAFATEFWAEVYRVLKPGGHVVAFSGTRTYHRMTVAIEDAGFEIRDQLAWLYGSGFPKSHDVSKAIDKVRDWTKVKNLNDEIRRARTESGLSLKEIGEAMMAATDGQYGSWYHRGGHMFFETGRSLPSRPEWDRLRNVLPISSTFHAVYEEAEREVIRYQEGTCLAVAPGQGEDRGATTLEITAPASEASRQWQGWGTALKPAWEPICLARKPLIGTVAENVLEHGTGALNIDGCRVAGEPWQTHRATGLGSVKFFSEGETPIIDKKPHTLGRWPANIVHDGSDEVVSCFPDAPGQLRAVTGEERSHRTLNAYGDFGASASGAEPRLDSGSAARFFYTAKADKLDRIGSKHPTVKPVDLMQWLCRMVTPPGGIVLDPFAGSGSTGEAAWREGFRAILIEREEEYQADIAARLNLADKGPATRKARAIKQAANDNLPLFKGAA